ncbi:sulfotransferase [Ruegeria sp. HKCCD8929]|uniref:sulfotransferase family protein n=1 Tax=Ruegeria sp. HKCCD8929 TaxID=2683006 RepID=UPI0014888D90|nr:sulfotransferase [Ruegeria sp. HKCCD8929]
MPLPPDGNVDFLIIGAAKCATTWLQRSLEQNPAIHMPGPELHYFSREYHRGSHWFRDQFDPNDATRLIGEKSNSYLTQPEAAGRIARDCPGVKLILQMRDPVQRAYSDYCMLFRRGEVSGDIRRYLDPDIAAEERFLNDGRYAHHLRRFYDLFPSEDILLLAYEDIRTAPLDQLSKVSRHVGFGDELRPPVQQRIKDKEAPVVPLGLRQVLAPFRPVLDPIRHSWPLRTLRGAVARKVAYPPLPTDIAGKMTEFYLKDVEQLRAYNPEVCRPWTKLQTEGAIESGAGAGFDSTQVAVGAGAVVGGDAGNT